MATLNTQHTHEVRSLNLITLQKHKEQLVHLESIPVPMSNYVLQRGWFLYGYSIKKRFPDIEACSETNTLGTHLSITNAKQTDILAVSAPDAEAIQRALKI